MPIHRVSLLLMVFGIFSFALKAQDDIQEKDSNRISFTSDIQVGMLAGGQIANDEFVYKSGFIAQYSLNTKISPWIDAGLGIALQSLETETILPIFLDVKARLREGEKAPFIGVNIGSSSGWSTYYRNFADYEYSGGFYFSPYYSFQFPVKGKVDFLLALGYIHQVGWIEYFTEFDESYLESFSMDFLTIRTGLRF